MRETSIHKEADDAPFEMVCKLCLLMSPPGCHCGLRDGKIKSFFESKKMEMGEILLLKMMLKRERLKNNLFVFVNCQLTKTDKKTMKHCASVT